MEYLFYTRPEQIHESGWLEIEGQEAAHIMKALRFRAGDEIMVADGAGNHYRCEIADTAKNSLRCSIQEKQSFPELKVKKILCLGVIKKRDRLEFAIEKAVELGADEICLFESDHTERSRVNKDRVEKLVLSAFKQSKRAWKPDVVYKSSLDDVLSYYSGYTAFMAAVGADGILEADTSSGLNIFLVGPEGGFSDREVALAEDKEVRLVTLGPNRLRAETAALTVLAKLL